MFLVCWLVLATTLARLVPYAIYELAALVDAFMLKRSDQLQIADVVILFIAVDVMYLHTIRHFAIIALPYKHMFHFQTVCSATKTYITF